MLDLANRLRDHIQARLREMISVTINDVRELERVHDCNAQRQFLSGKIAAYQEILKLLME